MVMGEAPLISPRSVFSGVRSSKFRHMYGTCMRRDACFEGVRMSSAQSTDSNYCAANPKFIAIALEVAGGGAFQILPLERAGQRVDYAFGRVSGHEAPITDLAWNPFNDNVIASSSEDGTIRLWFIPDGGVRTMISEWLCCLDGHGRRRVSQLMWHPTVDNLLASAGSDGRIVLWNVSTGRVVSDIHASSQISSFAFDRLGINIALATKDRRLCVHDARSGRLLTGCDGIHDINKPIKLLYVADGRILTTGFGRSCIRQYKLWDAAGLDAGAESAEACLVAQDIDYSSGIMFPFHDPDLNLVFLVGKGDGNIRYYELTSDPPYLHYLSQFQSSRPQRGVCMMPKRGLDIRRCEVARFYKLHVSPYQLIEPVSFTVPRRSDAFQLDLFPPTAAPTAALSVDDWLSGMDREPVQLKLHVGNVFTTCKPAMVKRSAPTADSKTTVQTSDKNNDRKWRFLANETKPDYRQKEERDDYPDLIKEEQIRLRKLHSAEEVAESRRGSTSTDEDAILSDGCYGGISSSEEPSLVLVPIKEGSHGSCPTVVMSGVHSPPARPTAIGVTQPRAIAPLARLGEDDAIIVVSQEHLRQQELRNCDSNPVSPMDTKHLPLRSRDAEATLVRKGSAPTQNKTRTETTRPGRIQPLAVEVQRSNIRTSPHPTPLSVRIPTSASPDIINSVVVQSPQSNSYSAANSTASSGAGDSAVRGRMEELEVSVAKLSSELEKSQGRENKLQGQVDRQTEEIDCLRHEVAWKDSRIEDLQAQLYRITHATG